MRLRSTKKKDEHAREHMQNINSKESEKQREEKLEQNREHM